MTLSLCMIVCDEAERMEDCLRSVRTLADEIIVVDTGSSDGTAERAAAQGARVIPFEWSDDFAAARNRAIAEARGDWVLVLDADERLFPRTFAAVRRLLAMSRPAAVQVFIRTYTDDWNLVNWQSINTARPEAQGFCGYFDVPQVRLFRRREGVRFEGLVHESVSPALERSGLGIYRADLVIHHYKQAGPAQQRRDRDRLILELSRRRCEREPDSPDVWRQRALAALELDERDEAATALERALALDPDRRDLCLQLGAVLTRSGRADRAVQIYTEALDRFPDEPELLQALGDVRLAAGQPAQAHDAFARSLELDPYLYRSLLGLGAIAMQEDRAEAAVDYFERAKSIHPESDVPDVNLGLLYLKQGRNEKALGHLRRAFAVNPKRWQSLAGLGKILFDTGRWEEARDWYRRAADARDCAPEVFVKLAACCTALGDPDEARRWAEQAASADPAYAEVPSLVPR